jgi:hypothetical protein
MYQDDDSVSTFHQKEDYSQQPITPSKTFTPHVISNPSSVLESSTSASKPNDISYQDESESISKLSDTQSRISNIVEDIKHLNNSFQHALSEMKLQSQQQASQQQQHETMLTEILALLKQTKITLQDSTTPSAQDNPPKQSTDTSGSSGVAGPG